MMGHKEKLKSGDEYDVVTKWRQVYSWKPGVLKRIKRQLNKRIRQSVKHQIRES